jgi:hypothetical protein
LKENQVVMIMANSRLPVSLATFESANLLLFQEQYK